MESLGPMKSKEQKRREAEIRQQKYNEKVDKDYEDPRLSPSGQKAFFDSLSLSQQKRLGDKQ